MNLNYRLPLLAALSLTAPLLPSEAQIAVLNGSIQEQEATAGLEYSASIVVRNSGAEAQEVSVYLTDYEFTADGKSAYGAAGTSKRSNARWITLGAQTVVIAPSQSSTITYRVIVPNTAGSPVDGSYWSMVMIEGKPSRPPAAKDRSIGISTVVRHGIQIVTHVGKEASAAVAFSNVSLAPGDSGMALRFDTENSGERARRLSLSVDLFNENGVLVGRFTKVRGLVYPGCGIRQIFNLGSIPKGKYHAFIVADAGDDDLFAGKFPLEI